VCKKKKKKRGDAIFGAINNIEGWGEKPPVFALV